VRKSRLPCFLIKQAHGSTFRSLLQPRCASRGFSPSKPMLPVLVQKRSILLMRDFHKEGVICIMYIFSGDKSDIPILPAPGARTRALSLSVRHRDRPVVGSGVRPSLGEFHRRFAQDAPLEAFSALLDAALKLELPPLLRMIHKSGSSSGLLLSMMGYNAQK